MASNMEKIEMFADKSVTWLAVAILAFFAAIWTVQKHVKARKLYEKFPLLDLEEEEGLGPKEAWGKKGFELMAKGLREHDGPFRVMTSTGPKIMLPNHFAGEFRKNENANLIKTFGQDNFAHWPGFDGITFLDSNERVFVDSIRTNLTQSIGPITDALVDETRFATPEVFGKPDQWREIEIKPDIGQFVARLTSRVLVGPELCRNPEWLKIALDYTEDMAQSSLALRKSSSILRPITYLFNPSCKRLRHQVRDARRMIQPLIHKRRAQVQQALSNGHKPEKMQDSIGWMATEAHGVNMDYAAGQLGMSVVGIHTTTEALAGALVDLCQNPQYFQPLRDEMIEVLKRDGWSRSTLSKLRLLDSFLKESQRMHPAATASVNRVMLKDFRLSNGAVLPKGSRIFVAGKFSDPDLYAEPEKFDAYRFLRLRDAPGQSNNWQHTSMTPEHLGFGYGDHGCPGRFFASNELKIAFCFLLLNYEWKLSKAENNRTFWTFAVATWVHPLCRVSFRSRTPEVQL